MQMAPPDVDLAVFEQPAQSLSVNPVTLSGMDCHGNSDTSLGFPIKYLPILRSRFKSDSRGRDMFLAASLTAYPRSGLSGAI